MKTHPYFGTKFSAFLMSIRSLKNIFSLYGRSEIYRYFGEKPFVFFKNLK